MSNSALYDETAELGLLACLLASPGIYNEVSHFLRPSHFYRQDAADAYGIYLGMADKGRGPDYVAWSRQADRNVLKEAATSVPPEAGALVSIKDHAGVIIEMHKRRRCVETGKRLQASGQNLQADIDGTLAQTQGTISELLVGGDGEMADMNQAIDEAEDDFGRRKRGEIKAVQLGYREIDEWLGSIEGGWVITIGARPGVGKTASLLDIALAGATVGLKSAIFSLEMTRLQLVYRLASKISGISSGILSNPTRLNPVQLDLRRKSADRLRQYPIYIDDKGGASIDYIIARSHHLAAKVGGLDMILIDYIQLVESTRQHSNRNDEVGYVSRSSKALAKALNVPLFSAAQLSRACEARQDKRGILSDLRESGSIEADSDIVAFLFREGYYNPNVANPNRAEFIVAKNRNGPTGTRFLDWEGMTTRFKDIPSYVPAKNVF